MPLPRLVAGKISDPRYSVLQQLSRLSLPAGFQLAAPGDPDNSTGAYGTVIPARRSFKPFVVGLIPPDVPVDFVAFRRAGAELTDIGTLAFTGAQAADNAPTSQPLTSQRAQVQNLGKVARVRQDADVAEVRRAVYNAYVKYGQGRVPSDATVNLIVAQMAAERGRAGGTIPTWNYNFGNSHAAGTGEGKYQAGYANLNDRRAAGYGRDGNPDANMEVPPKEPSGGTYFLTVDFRGNNDAYPVYYTGFTSLQEGVDYQVNLLMRRYPAAATASTPEEYVDGLVNGVSGFSYFEAPPPSYLRLMEDHYNSISSTVARGGLGGQIGGTVRPPQPSVAVNNAGPNDRFIMSVGSVSQLQSDPAGDRIGKFVEFDPSRHRLVDAQVQALRAEVEAIQAIPGLLLLVNPAEFGRSYQHAVDSSVKGRQKNIVHVWLERPFTISSSGVTAGQYVVSPDGNGGLTNQLRVFSASYQNLLSLLSIYKTNGIIYSGPEVRGDPRIRQLGYSVFIYYDNHIYIGSFDSFDIQDTELKPHNMSYSFKFNVRYDMDVGNDGRFTDFEVGVSNGFVPQVFPS